MTGIVAHNTIAETNRTTPTTKTAAPPARIPSAALPGCCPLSEPQDGSTVTVTCTLVHGGMKFTWCVCRKRILLGVWAYEIGKDFVCW